MIGNEKQTLYSNVEQERLWGKQNKPPLKANLHSKKKKKDIVVYIVVLEESPLL